MDSKITKEHSFASSIVVNAEITKFHIGKAMEWASLNDYKLYEKGWCTAGGSNGWHCTTDELVQKYIASL